MRSILIFTLGLFLVVSSSSSYADIADTNIADYQFVRAVTTVVNNNPGKSLGAAGCLALVLLPPAAAFCAATIVVGMHYDGDTQGMLKAAGVK